MSEPVRNQLRRPLPSLAIIDNFPTRDPPFSDAELLSEKHMHPWRNFTTEVTSFIATAPGLDNLIPRTDPAPESVIVGDKDGINGRFVQHVGQIVGQAWSASCVENLSHYRFHDAYADRTVSAFWGREWLGPSVPEVIVSRVQDGTGFLTRKFVGVLEAPWTVRLDRVFLSDRDTCLALEPHLGRLVKYMRVGGLKYGFLTTYQYTIFVRRAGPYRFEISDSIHHLSQEPSVRECFYYLGHITNSSSYKFDEDESFDTILLTIPEGASTSSTDDFVTGTYRQPAEGDSLSFSSITPDSILYGDGSTVTGIVEPVRYIRQSSNGRFVLEATWNTQTVIVKYWPEPVNETQRMFRYNNEVGIYKILPPSRFITEMLDHGNVMLSNKYHNGHIIILRKEEGEVFSRAMWQGFSDDEKMEFRQELLDAHAFLREYDLTQTDIRKDNILVKPDRKVVILDMEQMRLASHRRHGDDYEVKVLLDREIL
ncbi:hypothetical protein TWF696_006988 [Orbilia brochopaga]|uniref:Protein kinase domain-containing protein n=1 Tax=Orbilia brochopaga TaxID=3140254 RepID=A0AAV9URM6_9PEZI